MDQPTTSDQQRIGSVVNLRPASPVPLYYQLAQSITNAVRCGALRPGTILGPVRVVAEELRVSRNTVRHAMELLNIDNVIRPAGDGCHVVIAHETPQLSVTNRAMTINDRPAPQVSSLSSLSRSLLRTSRSIVTGQGCASTRPDLPRDRTG